MFRYTPPSFPRKWLLKHKARDSLPHFDVCVIGGGPAGVSAALRAVDYNKKVCLVEQARIGGSDLWNGALQSKTLWEMSKFVQRTRSISTRRIFKEDVLGDRTTINEDKMRQSLTSVAEYREKQLFHALDASQVKFLQGHAMFASPDEISVLNKETGEYNTVKADYFVIATGSSSRQHPHFATNDVSIISSETIMTQPLPESIVIIGAGVIGCEFASILANMGRTKVNIIDKAPRILPMEDEDIAMFVQEQLEKKGVTVHHEASLFDLKSYGDGEGGERVQYSIVNNRTKQQHSFDVARALISIGRVPQYSGLGLENIRCKVTDGKLNVDAFQRCLPYKHIYAAGDATMDTALVNVAEVEGRFAIEHMYSSRQEPRISFSSLPKISFLDEEVASVGMNEQECRASSIRYLVARYGYEFVSRAVAKGLTNGFIKLIVSNDKEKRVLGVRAVGAQASSVVELASLAIHNKESAYQLAELFTAYPAVTQGFQECLRMLLNRSILKPNVFPELVLKTWEPPGYERGRVYQGQSKK